MKYLIALLAVAGIVVSSLALHIHYMDPAAAPPCAVSAHWDCGTVNRGKYAVFPPLSFDEKPGAVHIPVAAIGIAGYMAIAIFALLGRMQVVLALALGGFFCAAYLSYIEAYVIETWCIYCLWSQTIIAGILLASLAAVIFRRRLATSTHAVLAE